MVVLHQTEHCSWHPSLKQPNVTRDNYFSISEIPGVLLCKLDARNQMRAYILILMQCLTLAGILEHSFMQMLSESILYFSVQSLST